MARPRTGNLVSLTELETMLDSGRRKLQALQKERDKLNHKLSEIDQEISTLAGRTTAAGRARNPQSLVATMEEVLRQAGKPMPVGQIMVKVQARGYRSNSANFRALVNQTLIKDERFESAARGVYQLTK